MARLKVKQISDFSSAVQTLIDNDTDQNAALIDALEASVDSLEGVAGGTVTADLGASVDSLETLAGNNASAISGNDTDISNLGLSVDSLETLAGTLATQADVDANEADADASIDSIETVITALAGDSEYIHDYSVMASATAFRTNVQVEHASDDDMQVYINGHAIGRVRTVDGTKYGWEHTSGNTNFDLHNIGYDLEADDVIYVVAHR